MSTAAPPAATAAPDRSGPCRRGDPAGHRPQRSPLAQTRRPRGRRRRPRCPAGLFPARRRSRWLLASAGPRAIGGQCRLRPRRPACFLARLVRRLRALRLGEDEVALAIERRAPGGLQNRLINTLQLSRDVGGAGASLIEAVVRRRTASNWAAPRFRPPPAPGRPPSARPVFRQGSPRSRASPSFVLWQPARFWRLGASRLAAAGKRRSCLPHHPDRRARRHRSRRRRHPSHRHRGRTTPKALTISTDSQGSCATASSFHVPANGDEVTHTLTASAAA